MRSDQQTYLHGLHEPIESKAFQRPSAHAAPDWDNIRHIFNIMPNDMATVMSRKLTVHVYLKFEDLDLILSDGFNSLDICSIQVVHSEQNMIYSSMKHEPGRPQLTGRK